MQYKFRAKSTFGVERPHVPGLLSAIRPDLNLMVQMGLWELLEEKFIDGHIQDRNHLLRVADQLTVQVTIKHLNVSAVDVQEWGPQSVDLVWKKMASKKFQRMNK